MAVRDLPRWMTHASEEFGTSIEPETGRLRINYKQAAVAPVAMGTLVYKSTVDQKQRLLLAKRIEGNRDAAGKWSLINGLIDDVESLTAIQKQEITAAKLVKSHVIREVLEETGLIVRERQVALGASYWLQNPSERRGYYVFPARVDLGELETAPAIILNDEHTDYAWVLREQVNPRRYPMLADTQTCIDLAFAA
ncbi:MAG: NUDIX hydrolase [Candidatus Saccharimonadales bacterium]